MTRINIKRVYQDPSGENGDGLRVFVDRLWPRGESKEKFHYDLWAKDVAPSTELREWYHADEQNRWEEFVRRYTAELEANPAARKLLEKARTQTAVTLLYGSRDTLHNNAAVVRDYLVKNL